MHELISDLGGTDKLKDSSPTGREGRLAKNPHGRHPLMSLSNGNPRTLHHPTSLSLALSEVDQSNPNLLGYDMVERMVWYVISLNRQACHVRTHIQHFLVASVQFQSQVLSECKVLTIVS